MTPEEKVKSLHIDIPAVEPRFNFLPGVVVNDLLYISGQTPEKGTEMIYTGRVGTTISVEEAQKGARLACLNCLGEVRSVLGSLNRVERVVRVIGYVRSGEDFGEQPIVINAASELLIEIFGEKGKHARAALGTSELPFNACVELEMIFQVKEEVS
ncbi:RidA family protein [Alkalicoccus daliensis]|uniref:Enamine deaminase RidA, house cleaning of reactive enamine intermediates, YjgF/YER057c/UK114 family n=1 Tax=Alkalicoccus daliensis TaxID=745820 RepID=A0A1H0GDV8_9BACI|nr:RidA family protein [Alkalicoccus daliensis]SDO05044.1 Enamine deaminase RidA, house cleaning of reactive enamine intermediates, YjgF/YER057c/UK114 family [Alkalicoccus daliensis]